MSLEVLHHQSPAHPTSGLQRTALRSAAEAERHILEP